MCLVINGDWTDNRAAMETVGLMISNTFHNNNDSNDSNYSNEKVLL
jgi:hypothetical protein